MEYSNELIVIIGGTAWLIPLLRAAFAPAPVAKEDQS
jgi:hypothetical protein